MRESKKVKNQSAFSVELFDDDAQRLREVSKRTGIPMTMIIRNAVKAYLPKMAAQLEAMEAINTTTFKVEGRD